MDHVRFESGDGSLDCQFVFDNFRFNNVTDPTVVPEPATFVLVAGGLALFGLARVRRARTS